MSLYRCVNKFCDENVDLHQGAVNEVILNDREKEIPFSARVLLTCGHSICEKCIYGLAVKNKNFYNCDDCGKTTSFSQRTIDKVKNNKPKLHPIVRWNEDGADDLNYEAFSIGAAFNSGRISVTATPVVDLDEMGQAEAPNIPVHSYRDEPEVVSIPTKISNAPDGFKAVINDGVTMYRLCGKSLKQLFDAKAAVNRKYVATKEAIRRRFHILHGLLQLEEAKLMKELKKSKDVNIKTLSTKEKEIDGIRSHLKGQILRSPQFAAIQSGNPVKNEIGPIRTKRLKIDAVAELEDHLSSLNKPHDELRESIVKLTDFSKAVNFEVKIAFSPLISISSAPITPVISAPSVHRKSTQSSLMHIPFVKQQLATIHDVKDSGYFDAHLPIDKTAASILNKAISKRISLFLHPPITSRIKPQNSYIVWHDHKKEWVRAKLTRFEEYPENSEKENFCLLQHNIKSKKAVVLLTDYNNEIYKTRIENLRESTAELSDINIYARLLKVWKCRLKNVQADSSSFRKYVLSFCPNNITVKLLILSEPNGDTYTYDVDVVHNLNEPSGPQPTLIEYLIYAGVAKLRDGREEPYSEPHLLKNFKEPPGFSINPTHPVDVTYIKSPNYFYVNRARERQEIDDLEKKLADIYQKPELSVAYRLYYPRKGFPCAARCELFCDKNRKKERIFRRGNIISIDRQRDGSGERIVFYAVDYGEQVIVAFSDLRILPESFVKFPKQAFKCSLANIQPKAGSWGANAIKEFQSYFQAVNTLTSIIVIDKSADMHNVILTIHHFHGEEDGIINDVLVKNGFAVKAVPVLRSNNDATNSNSLASRSSLNRTNNQNFGCYNLLREMVCKFKRYRLTTIDSLIKIKITHFNSPSSFFIQIATPEVQNDIRNFTKRLDEEYANVDVSQPSSQAYQGFPVGEICVYLYRPKHWHSVRWRRGVIEEFIGGGIQLASTDPRAKNQVSGDAKYRLKDKDFGIDVEVERKYIRTIPPSHPLRKDTGKCIECFIADIKPVDNAWSSEAIEHCNDILTKATVELFIKIGDILEENQPAKIPVDLIFKKQEAPSIFEPPEDHYFSLKYELIECNYAHKLSDIYIDKEIEIDDDSRYSERKIPQQLSDDSSISALKSVYYSDTQPTEAINYMEAEKPASPDFSAICTHIDEGAAIWFTFKSDSPKDPTIGTINKVIFRSLIQKEKFETFRGNADHGRACIVYADNRWWRGKILNNNGNKINVLYIDTGVKREHFIDDLSSEIFCEGIPGLALYGKLYKCVPFPGRAELLKNYLRDYVLNKDIRIHWENFRSERDMLISVEVKKGEEGRYFDLKSDLLPHDLIQETQEMLEDYPNYIRTSIELMQRSQYCFPNYDFNPNIYYPVIYCDLVVENYLCLQLLNFVNADSPEKEEINDLCFKFEEDDKLIRSQYMHFNKAVDFPVGSSCCACWNGDWFRGIVSEIVEPRSKYKVFFVDWGNSDIIDKQDMRILPDEYCLRGRPIFGFFVRLSNIRPRGTNVWTDRLFDSMKRIVTDFNGSLMMKVKSKKAPFDVELWVANDDQRPFEFLFQDLIRDGHLELNEENS